MSEGKTVTFPVEGTHVMMFARSIGDYNAAYHQPGDGGTNPVGARAVPPTFPQAVAQFDPEYPLRIKEGEAWFGSGSGPSGIEGRPATSGGLHAEQHFEYTRPIRPGETLTVKYSDGETWEKQSRRAGKLVFTERLVDYYDKEGNHVCRARGVGVKTERPVDQG